MINLHASSAPMELPDIELGESSRARLYRIQRLEDGRKRYRLRLGPFLREEEADAALSRIRDIYPGALTATAVDEDLSVFATIRVKAAVPPRGGATPGDPAKPAASMRDAAPARQPAKTVPIQIPAHAVAPRAALATVPGPAPTIDRLNAATAPTAGAGRIVDQPVSEVSLVDAPPVGEPSKAAPFALDTAPACAPVPLPVLEFPELTLVDPPSAPAEISVDASPGTADSPSARKSPQLDAAFDVLSASLSLVEADAPQGDSEVSTSGTRSAARAGESFAARSGTQADKKAASPSVAGADEQAESKPAAQLHDELAVEPNHTLSATSAARAGESFAARSAAQVDDKSAAKSVARADAEAVAKPAATPNHKPAVKPNDKASAVSAANPADKHASGAGAKVNVKLVAKAQLREAAPAPRPPAAAPSAGLDGDLLPEIELNLETTQTLRPLTSRELEDAKALRWFVVELAVSDRAFDPGAVPKLDIFLLYRLYSVASMDQGRHVHALRLGFFGEEIAASAVANYLLAYYDKATVKASERRRA